MARRRKPRADRLSKVGKIAAGVVAALASIVGIATGVRSLVSDDGAEPVARILAISHHGTGVVPPTRLVGAPEDYSPAELDRLGDVFSVRVELSGDQTTPVRWTMFDAKSGLAVPDFGRTVTELAAEGSTPKRQIIDIWIPNPPKRGTYFVRITLEDRDQRDSTQFDY